MSHLNQRKLLGQQRIFSWTIVMKIHWERNPCYLHIRIMRFCIVVAHYPSICILYTVLVSLFCGSKQQLKTRFHYSKLTIFEFIKRNEILVNFGESRKSRKSPHRRVHQETRKPPHPRVHHDMKLWGSAWKEGSKGKG